MIRTFCTMGLVLLAAAACGEEEEPPALPVTVGSGGATTTATTATTTTTTGGLGGEGGSGGDCPPTDVAALEAFLAAGDYLTWSAESGAHESMGPHFGDVRTFVNAPMVDSLEAGDPTHPVCSAAVKELYGDGASVLGHAVMIKTVDGNDGNAWFWYEEYEGSVYAAGNGDDTCTGCHSSGVDFFRSPFPLQ